MEPSTLSPSIYCSFDSSLPEFEEGWYLRKVCPSLSMLAHTTLRQPVRSVLFPLLWMLQGLCCSCLIYFRDVLSSRSIHSASKAIIHHNLICPAPQFCFGFAEWILTWLVRLAEQRGAFQLSHTDQDALPLPSLTCIQRPFTYRHLVHFSSRSSKRIVCNSHSIALPVLLPSKTYWNHYSIGSQHLKKDCCSPFIRYWY